MNGSGHVVVLFCYRITYSGLRDYNTLEKRRNFFTKRNFVTTVRVKGKTTAGVAHVKVQVETPHKPVGQNISERTE